ncbi:MAG: transglutaminase-like domain-containing protein [Arenicella sp.]
MTISNHYIYLFFALCAALLAVIGNKYYFSSSVPESSYQEQRIIRFSYEISNQTRFAIEDAQFSVYLPVLQLANQRAKSIKASRVYSELSDELGNRVGQFDVGIVPPFGKKQLSLTAVIETTAMPNRIKLKNKDLYIRPEPFIEVDEPVIIALANDLKGENEQQSLKNIYDWTSTNIQYAGYVPEDKGALYALKNRKGDCTEYAYSVVALARALGIPARVIGGYVYEKNTVVSAPDYHNWAEVYLDERWQIIDAQNNVFMEKSQHYIAMRVLSDSKISLLGNSHRFLVAKEGLKVQLL